MKKIILAILVASIGMSGYGQIVYHEKDSYKVGELYYAKLTDSTAEVLENQDIYSSYPRIIDVPSVVEIDGREYQVVRIGDRAFQLDCIGVESIRIPETIREIGQGAFAGITVSVKLPDSLRKIEWAAFGGAVIDTFIVPRGVEMMAEDVLSQAMVRVLKVAEGNRNYVVVDSVALCSADTSLLLSYQNSRPDTEYTVPASVRRIAGSAFYGNETLKRVVLPEGLEEIGTYAFGNGLECLEIPADRRIAERGSTVGFCLDSSTGEHPLQGGTGEFAEHGRGHSVDDGGGGRKRDGARGCEDNRGMGVRIQQ